MKYFLDTEFYERPKTIELISIGVVCEDGREFYCESLDYAQKLDNSSEWLKNNVIPHLWHLKMGCAGWWHKFPNIQGGLLQDKRIGDLLQEFIIDENPEFWGYYCDYDWVVTCWLFGSMIDLPKKFPMFCRDLRQLADDIGCKELPQQADNEHHALNDARWNKDVFDYLMTLKN